MLIGTAKDNIVTLWECATLLSIWLGLMAILLVACAKHHKVTTIEFIIIMLAGERIRKRYNKIANR